jgi:hypothetical protein
VLRAAGWPLYPVNPLAVARYRERTSVSGKKSDHADAMALANILRTDAHLHRRLPGDSAVDNDHVPACWLTGGGPPKSPALARLATGGYPIAW